MKKYLPMLLLATALGGCAQLQTLSNDFSVLSQSSVPAADALAAANAFDAIEASAQAYLVFCKTNLTVTACSASNRRAVIKNGKLGQTLRNQIEGYITTNTTVPSAIFSSLQTIVNNLKASPAANGASQ